MFTRSIFLRSASDSEHKSWKVVESRCKNIHASPLRPLRLGEKNIPRQLLFSRKAAEDAKASQGLDQEVFGLNKKVMKSGKEKEELLKREAERLAESKA